MLKTQSLALKARRDLTEAEKAWLAAAIDGEGTIFIRKDKRRQDSYEVRVEVANTDKSFLENAVRICGVGCIFKEKLRPRPRRVCYRFVLGTVATTLILPQIMPYLIIKRNKAQYALAIIQTKCKIINAILNGTYHLQTKEERAKHMHDYYLGHLHERRAFERNYYRKNKVRILERMKAYRLKNKDLINTKRRLQYRTDPRYREYKRRYREKNGISIKQLNIPHLKVE